MQTYSFQPLIGISGGLLRTNEWSPPVVGHRQSYVEAVLQAGGLPVVLPPLTDPRALRALYERLDGVLLAGGDGKVGRKPARQRPGEHDGKGRVQPAGHNLPASCCRHQGCASAVASGTTGGAGSRSGENQP